MARQLRRAIFTRDSRGFILVGVRVDFIESRDVAGPAAFDGAAGEPLSDVVLDSVLTCPHCGHAKRETMPTDACQFFYECENFKTLLRPKAGDCCVFCSFGSVKCPPVQAQNPCCR